MRKILLKTWSGFLDLLKFESRGFKPGQSQEKFVIKLKTDNKTEKQAANKDSFGPNEETVMDLITSEKFDKKLKNASNFNEKSEKKDKKNPMLK